MTLGLISDTHGFFDARLPELFRDVDHILHAGDIGSHSVVIKLEHIAPVTAVLGNTDFGLSERESELVKLGERKFLIQHIVDPLALDPMLKDRVKRRHPGFIVFGHTHKAFDQVVNGVRFINPGYAGRPRSGVKRTVARLVCDEGREELEFIGLD